MGDTIETLFEKQIRSILTNNGDLGIQADTVNNLSVLVNSYQTYVATKHSAYEHAYVDGIELDRCNRSID